MVRVYKRLRECWKKAIVLFSIGLVISLFIRQNLNPANTIFFSDILFVIAMVFIISALWELVSNLGLFNGMVFGARCFYRIFRKRIGPSAEVKEEYINFVNARRKYGDISILLLIGIGFLGMSVLPVLLV